MEIYVGTGHAQAFREVCALPVCARTHQQAMRTTIEADQKRIHVVYVEDRGCECRRCFATVKLLNMQSEANTRLSSTLLFRQCLSGSLMYNDRYNMQASTMPPSSRGVMHSALSSSLLPLAYNHCFQIITLFRLRLNFFDDRR